MHEIRTQVDIAAGASLVWSVLTDFSRYPTWNPTIRGVEGDLSRGATLRIAERVPVAPKPGPQRNKPPTVRKTVGTLEHIREPRQLTWTETSRLGGLLGTQRRFSIESLPDGNVRFHQVERIRGMLAPFVWRKLSREHGPAFERMNRALKARAARAASSAPRTVG
jgi:hypothetical protein